MKIKLFPQEELIFEEVLASANQTSTIERDEKINNKYVKGDVRIVTEQARYQLSSVPGMVESADYNLNPEFQRRHRWDNGKRSRLIESFIMNVPIPPVFLYEDSFSHYEVMDGLQRMTSIYEFYRDRFPLESLEEWPELNGRYYSELPEQIRRGIDRRHLSSIILLQETAKTEAEALRLKQLVFERINSGGVGLEPQESRNAIYNGPLNQLCIKLARNKFLCKMWGIPLPSENEVDTGELPSELLQNESFRKMADVELVLRFFAYRQRLTYQKGALKLYLDMFLKQGNLFPQKVFNLYEDLFKQTTELVYETLGESAFWLWRYRARKWAWLSRPTTVLYDPIMFVFSKLVDRRKELVARSKAIQDSMPGFYQKHYKSFEGRYTNLSNITERNELFESFIDEALTKPA